MLLLTMRYFNVDRVLGFSSKQGGLPLMTIRQILAPPGDSGLRGSPLRLRTWTLPIRRKPPLKPPSTWCSQVHDIGQRRIAKHGG